MGYFKPTHEPREMARVGSTSPPRPHPHGVELLMVSTDYTTNRRRYDGSRKTFG